MKAEFLIACDLFIDNPEDSYLCFLLSSVIAVLLFPLWITPLYLCTVFHTVSLSIDKVLSAYAFDFGDFNARLKDWLMYSCGNDRAGEFL